MWLALRTFSSDHLKHIIDQNRKYCSKKITKKPLIWFCITLIYFTKSYSSQYCSLCKNFVYCFLFFVLSLLQFLVEISLSTALSFLKNRTLLHLSHLPYCGLLTLALLVVGVGAVGEEAVIWTLGAAWGFGQFGLGCVLAGQFVFDLGDFEWFRVFDLVWVCCWFVFDLVCCCWFVFDLVWAWVFGVGVLLMVNLKCCWHGCVLG